MKKIVSAALAAAMLLAPAASLKAYDTESDYPTPPQHIINPQPVITTTVTDEPTTADNETKPTEDYMQPLKKVKLGEVKYNETYDYISIPVYTVSEVTKLLSTVKSTVSIATANNTQKSEILSSDIEEIKKSESLQTGVIAIAASKSGILQQISYTTSKNKLLLGEQEMLKAIPDGGVLYALNIGDEIEVKGAEKGTALHEAALAFGSSKVLASIQKEYATTLIVNAEDAEKFISEVTKEAKNTTVDLNAPATEEDVEVAFAKIEISEGSLYKKSKSAKYEKAMANIVNNPKKYAAVMASGELKVKHLSTIAYIAELARGEESEETINKIAELAKIAEEIIPTEDE